MRIYPSINLPLFYNNGIDYDSRPTRVELGKGGVIDRSRTHWQNTTKRSFNISATLKDRDELNTFLKANRGLPFEFRAEGVNPPGLFVCNSWTWKWLVYVDGNGVWSLSAKFDEIFRPGYVFTDAGVGNVKLPTLSVSGVGTITGVSPVGSGTLTLSSLGVSGAGIDNTTANGSGSLEMPSLRASGSGILNPLFPGSGTLTWPVFSTTGSAVAGQLWTPAQLTTALWLKASDSSTLFDATSGGSLPAADNGVARIQDKSGNGLHAIQNTSGARPIRKVSILNGKDVIRFDGSDDFLSSSSNPLSDSNNFSLFVVSSGALPFTRGRDGSGAGWSILLDSTYISVVANSPIVGYTASSSLALSGFNITGGTWQSGTFLRFYTNGTLDQSNNSVGTGMRSSAVGYDLGRANSVFGTVDFFELVLTSSVLTTTDIDKLVGYLAHESGLTSKLDSGHPYKTSPPLV